MKQVLTVLAMVIALALNAQKYNMFSAHNDSVLVYQTYKNQIAFMEQAARDRNFKDWNNRSTVDDTLTASAKMRLSQWNHTPYEAADTREMEGFGTAYVYPAPGEMKKPKFSVIYPGTRFIVGADGKTKATYLEKIYFDEGGVAINTERVMME